MTIVEELDKKSNRPHRSKNIVDAMKYANNIASTPQNIAEAVKKSEGSGSGTSKSVITLAATGDSGESCEYNVIGLDFTGEYITGGILTDNGYATEGNYTVSVGESEDVEVIILPDVNMFISASGMNDSNTTVTGNAELFFSDEANLWIVKVFGDCKVTVVATRGE